jgi:hypothetical protein
MSTTLDDETIDEMIAEMSTTKIMIKWHWLEYSNWYSEWYIDALQSLKQESSEPVESEGCKHERWQRRRNKEGQEILECRKCGCIKLGEQPISSESGEEMIDWNKLYRFVPQWIKDAYTQFITSNWDIEDDHRWIYFYVAIRDNLPKEHSQVEGEK